MLPTHHKFDESKSCYISRIPRPSTNLNCFHSFFNADLLNYFATESNKKIGKCEKMKVTAFIINYPYVSCIEILYWQIFVDENYQKLFSHIMWIRLCRILMTKLKVWRNWLHLFSFSPISNLCMMKVFCCKVRQLFQIFETRL